VAKKVRKSKKATDMNQTDTKETNQTSEEPVASITSRETEQLITETALGKKRGFLTYEEMNDTLPDNAVSPSRLERFLGALDEMGIRLIDESDADARNAHKDDEDFEEDSDAIRARRTSRRAKTRLSRGLSPTGRRRGASTIPSECI